MTDGPDATLQSPGQPVSEPKRPSALREREPDPALYRDVYETQADPQEPSAEEPDASVPGTESEAAERSDARRTSFASVEDAQKHFQSQKDKEVAALKAEFSAKIAKLEGQMEMAAKEQPQAPQQEANNPYGNILANADLVLPEDSTLVGEEPALKQAVVGLVRQAVQEVMGISTEVQQREVTQAATRKVADVARGWTPEQQQGVMVLADKFPQALVEDPDRFIAFAKLELGIQDPAPTPEPVPTPTPTKLAGQATAASDRPTAVPTSASTGYVNRGATMMDKIKAAIHDHPR